jgi:hypothetical protein
MSDTEGKRAQREALSQATRPMTSRRAEVWAGMMRYLSGEARREHDKAEQERGGRKRGEESGPKGG